VVPSEVVPSEVVPSEVVPSEVVLSEVVLSEVVLSEEVLSEELEVTLSEESESEPSETEPSVVLPCDTEPALSLIVPALLGLESEVLGSVVPVPSAGSSKSGLASTHPARRAETATGPSRRRAIMIPKLWGIATNDKLGRPLTCRGPRGAAR
jgi:hypothetical protein